MAGTRPAKRARLTKGDQANLRSMPAEPRLFWKQSREEQLTQKVWDKNANSLNRLLPNNETAALTLNEISCHRGRGYFFYLPSKEVYKRQEDSSLLPESRKSGEPGRDYPALLFMDYAWTENERASFNRDSQRARYLRCNALMNPPAGITPLYAIQWADHSRSQTYVTTKPSLIVFAEVDIYLATTDECDNVIGRNARHRKPKGIDVASRLDTAPYLFPKTNLSKDKELLKSGKEKMERFKIADMEAVYDGILRRCRPGGGGIPPSFSASRLRDVVPRPLAPEDGIALGEAEGTAPSPAAESPPSSQ